MNITKKELENMLREEPDSSKIVLGTRWMPSIERELLPGTEFAFYEVVSITENGYQAIVKYAKVI
jgi:hypothetical protein